MTFVIFVLLMLLCIFVLIAYALCVMTYEADERAKKMYKTEWQSKPKEQRGDNDWPQTTLLEDRRRSYMIYRYKEVYFGEFCPRCEFEKNAENEAPCDQCLEEPVNENSHKPVRFIEKKQ